MHFQTKSTPKSHQAEHYSKNTTYLDKDSMTEGLPVGFT